MDTQALKAHLSGFKVHYDAKLVDDQEQLQHLLAEARALIVRNRTQVTPALLAHAPRLEVVGRLGVGLDNIDLEACKNRGIAVYPATGANDVSVAEYVITASLVLLRGAWFASQAVAMGDWPRPALSNGLEMSAKVLGLIGFGNVSRETSKRARALGMQVVAYDPYLKAEDPAWQLAQSVDLDTLLSTSDVVSLHVPGGPGSANLLNAARLDQLKRGAIVINTARGGVLDEAALVARLKSGALAGAALDVFATEPVTRPSGTLFADVPNLLLTPHIAGVTQESNQRVSAVIAQKVKEHLSS
jgi:(S)-sulfolactate dehydrogenase